MKVIEVIADAGHIDTINSIAEQFGIHDVWCSQINEDGRIACRLLVAPEERQAVLDALQSILRTSENARILILPVEASLPKPLDENRDGDQHRKRQQTISREELFDQVSRSGTLDANYMLLVFLSAIVASIGLIEDNVAVIVGAMVIAPLLGPNIALSLGTALGEKKMVADALAAVLLGIALAITTGSAIGIIWPGSLDSTELMLRTDASYAGTAIALASGAAASLSLVTSISSVLVGVMVAVALMPPAVTIGLMLSSGDHASALGAALLLMINIVCINLSAKLVFLMKGIVPRTWLEARRARQSQILTIAAWIILLLALSLMIALRKQLL